MEASMTGEVRTAMKKMLGDKVMAEQRIYNDWVGRKTLPNKRVFKCEDCVFEEITLKEQASFRRSLQQRLAKFGLKVLRITIAGPFTFDGPLIQKRWRGIRQSGSLWVETIEINS